ncbi:transcription initiation factor IIA subunit 1-like [Lycorma delicatula]|uniref:transcription initiation factor IIA subunit 1-like n=1 Tax=Lycorma delicatula TaxID=130591 RepID=UPI003F514F49
MALSQTSVLKLYTSVIEDVIGGVREAFLDEGVDEQVLQELKQIWESKLLSSKAVDVQPDPPEPQPPIVNSQKDVGKYLNKGSVVSQQQSTTQHVAQNAATNSFLQEFNNKPVPIQITLPPQQGSNDLHQRVLTIQVPASALQGNQLQSVLTGSVISATMALPQHLASALLQQHVTAALQGQASSGVTHQQQQQQQQQQMQQQAQQNMTNQINNHVTQPNDSRQLFAHHNQAGPGTVSQLDGQNDTSDDDDEEEEEDEDDADDEDIDDKDDEENEDNDGGAEEEPLNSGDDVSEEDPTDMFETDNVVVCQYDKITRSRNKWKFHLKDGIMNLAGKDFVFQKANGDAEW